MTRSASAVLAALLILAVAACGDDDNSAATTTTLTDTTTTTEPQEETVEVHVTAELGGLGCVRAVESSGLEIGNDRRLTLEDARGRTLGVATFAPTPGGEETCDWSATVPDVSTDIDFYTASTATGELITVSAAELEGSDWTITAHINIDGSVSVR